jgi:hypothetical protein
LQPQYTNTLQLELLFSSSNSCSEAMMVQIVIVDQCISELTD